MNYFDDACKVVADQLGHNVVLALATAGEHGPSVRNVNGYYRDGRIYVATHALSHKMRQIAGNNAVAFCRGYDPEIPFYEGFLEGAGTGKNLGHPTDAQNQALREEIMEVFSDFYHRHVNEADPGTCILMITVDRLVAFDGEYKYTVDYPSQSAERMELAIG